MTTQRTRGKAPPKDDLRTSLPLKLRPGQDDDLLTWYKAQPKGKRQEALRQALRAGMNGAMNGRADMERIEMTTRAIWEAMNDLPGYLDTLMQRFAVTSVQIAPPSIEAEPTPRVENAELERRASRLKKAKW